MLGSAMLREASWSRSNSFWGTFRFKRRSATLGASSGFDQPSMIALASSRIRELGARLWKGSRRSGSDSLWFRIADAGGATAKGAFLQPQAF